METEKAIRNIYAEREKFIIIGLTGRTGSGYTTVSDILKTEKFDDLWLHEPKKTKTFPHFPHQSPSLQLCKK